MRHPSPLLICSLLLAACGDDDGAPAPDAAADAAPIPDAAADAAPPSDVAALPPDFSSSPARVIVTGLGSGTGETYVTQASAALRAAAEPTLYAVADPEQDGCRRLASNYPFCTEPCATDALCTADNVCTPIPPLRSAGTLHLASGAVERDLAWDPLAGYASLYEPGLDLVAGEELTVTAPGEDLAGFTLEAPVGPPLVITHLEALRLTAGEDLVITWTPADPGARVRLTLNSDTAGHGRYHPSVIECDVADGAGAITVAAALVTAHLEPGNWGCGDCASSSLVRYRRATTLAGDAEVELRVERRVDLYLVDY